MARRGMVMVASYPGDPSSLEIDRLATAGERPRKEYLELARALGADVIDANYMLHRGRALSRLVARGVGLAPGQILEAFLGRNEHRYLCVWGDRIGLPLALIFKLTRSRRDLVLVSAWLSRWKKAVFLRELKVHTHLGGIVNYSSVQMQIAATRLGVPREKLHLAKQAVDERFWRPDDVPTETLICSVGWEARDYATLIRATGGLDLQVELAVGAAGLFPAEGAVDARTTGESPGRRMAPQFRRLKRTFSYRLYQEWMRQVARQGLPANVKMFQQLNPRDLRSLYSRALFVVIPLHDVESDCGVTAVTEALAMGKAVIVTRTQGQIDIVKDGEHGMYVPPGDARALRAAIEHLLANPEEAERMGRAGRQLVEKHHKLDDYVARVAAIVQRCADGAVER